jgi:D-alanine-D-alanine ligase
MQNVLVIFGGVSAEHEVSIITGLQVLENIDRSQYHPFAIYINQRGEALYIPNLTKRRDFHPNKGVDVQFGRNRNGAFIQVSGGMSWLLGPQRIYVSAAYLALHGGLGEGGPVQGLMETLIIPATGPKTEGAVITMNKSLTKEVLMINQLPTVPGISVLATQVQQNVQLISADIIAKLGLPLIIKPSHFGSSIGIQIANSEVELQKFLTEAAQLDPEILVEKKLANFVEYNCAVRTHQGQIQVSEVEKPIARDAILSFADKYQRGGKKTGGDGGMASLNRELPALISSELRTKLQSYAKQVYMACRCAGMVRIDFMVIGDGAELYVTEVNAIPGSMAFYLWEASGISFKDQITHALEQAISDHDTISGRKLEYQTDIVQKFVTAK